MPTLSPEGQAVLDIIRRRGTQQLERERPDRLDPIAQRVGLRSPQVAQMESIAREGVEGRVGEARTGLLMEELQRKRALEDFQRKVQEGRRQSFEQWQQQERMAGLGHEHALSQMEKGYEYDIKRMQEQDRLLQEREEREKKARRQQLIGNILTGVVGGALTGGIGGLVGGGLSVGQGALLGAVAPGAAVQQAMQPGTQQTQTPQFDMSQYLAGGNQFQAQYDPIQQVIQGYGSQQGFDVSHLQGGR